MSQFTPHRHMRSMITVAGIVIGVIVIGAGIANSHGGKIHAANPFSALEAVQKATQLYNIMIIAGDLPEDWETGLSSIHVSVRGAENSRETVVQFKRSGGDPDSVYFFFDYQGKYAGSNFTGKEL